MALNVVRGDDEAELCLAQLSEVTAPNEFKMWLADCMNSAADVIAATTCPPASLPVQPESHASAAEHTCEHAIVVEAPAEAVSLPSARSRCCEAGLHCAFCDAEVAPASAAPTHFPFSPRF